MKISIIKVSKWFILTFSFCMFWYQFQIAISKLIDPPVAETADIFNIADTKLPMITICARNQWNQTSLQNFGYFDNMEFLAGFGGFEEDDYVFAWGAQHNLSYVQLLDGVLNIDTNNPYEVMKPEDKDYESEPIVYETRFYPKFGLCADIQDYRLTKNGDVLLDIEVNMFQQFFDNAYDLYRNNFTAQIFLTDMQLRTKTSLHLQSHWGSSINIENGWDYQYVVKVEHLSIFNPKKPANCREYVDEEYEGTVQEKLHDLFHPLIDCVPPWVSEKDQCTGVINATEEVTDKYWYNTEVYDTFESISDMIDYPAQKRSTKPCTVTRSNVMKNAKKFTEKTLISSMIRFQFDNLVVQRTKMLAYGFSDFLIDLGSSLGLWFGLSVFGITDLGIAALQFVKRMQVVKRRKKKIKIQSEI